MREKLVFVEVKISLFSFTHVLSLPRPCGHLRFFSCLESKICPSGWVHELAEGQESLEIGRPALLGMVRELGEAQLLSFRSFKACLSAQAS